MSTSKPMMILLVLSLIFGAMVSARQIDTGLVVISIAVRSVQASSTDQSDPVSSQIGPTSTQEGNSVDISSSIMTSSVSTGNTKHSSDTSTTQVPQSSDETSLNTSGPTTTIVVSKATATSKTSTESISSSGTSTVYSSASDRDTSSTILVSTTPPPGSRTTSSSSTTVASSYTTNSTSATHSSSSSVANSSSFQKSGGCLPGSQCAWELGLGLGLGIAFVIFVFFLICRTYRKHVEASHRQHHCNWENRGSAEGDEELESGSDQAWKMTSLQESQGATVVTDEGEYMNGYGDSRAIDQGASVARYQQERLGPRVNYSLKRKPIQAVDTL